MQKLPLILFLLTLPALAQIVNQRVDGVVWNDSGSPAPGAKVAACTQSASGQVANISVSPCLPAAKLCSSLVDTACTGIWPVTADGRGNYSFYIPLTQIGFTYQFYGSGLAMKYLIDQGVGSGGGTGTPLVIPGQDTWCIFNDALSLGASSLCTFNKATGDFTIAGTSTANSFRSSGSGPWNASGGHGALTPPTGTDTEIGFGPAGQLQIFKAGAQSPLDILDSGTGTTAAGYDTRNYLVCDGTTNDTTALTALLATIGSTPSKIVYALGQCLLSNITLPVNVINDFTAGGGIKVVTGQKVTIVGPIVAPTTQIFFNALVGQGTIDFTGGYAVDKVLPEWWGASPGASASVNTPAIQAAIYGAFGCGPTACRTNPSGNHKYNRELHFSGLYDINDELKFYHVLGFYISGVGRLKSGLNQTATNKRIIDGQSISYGEFNQLLFTTSATQDATHPLVDLDDSGAQGVDLAPQFIDFRDSKFSGNAQAAVGLQIAKSGGAAQGSNISCWDCSMSGFTQAAEQIGLTGAYATNALDDGFYGGDIQSSPLYGIQVWGGQIIVRDTTFENGFLTQTGYDVFCQSSQNGCVMENVRSEGRQLFSSSGAAAGTQRLINSNTIFQANPFYNLNGGFCYALTTSSIGQIVSGTPFGGDGAYYLVSNVGTFGGLCLNTASSGSATTIVKSGAAWVDDAYIGQQATIMAGTGIGQYCVITSNTATTINCTAGWLTNFVPNITVVNPDATSQFIVEPNWGTAGTVTSSGTVNFARMNFNVISMGAYAVVQNCFLPGGKVAAAGFLKDVTVTRVDWMPSGALDTTYVITDSEDVRVERGSYGSKAGAIQSAWIPWSYARNGGTPFSGPSQKQMGTVPIIWSNGALGGGTATKDVGIGGRSDPNSGNTSISRNILETYGTIGRPTPFGVDIAGTDTDIQGGLPSGAGAPGNINFWTGVAGSTGSSLTDGVKRWRITGPGHLVAFADNTYDIGGSATTLRPRHVYVGTDVTSPAYLTTTNCAAVGTAASPSVAACAAAPAGSFSCATAATGATCQVNTTAVTANSQIFVQQVVSEGARLGVTCNVASVLPASPLLLSKSAGVSFTLTMGTITTNPGCFIYSIVN